MREKRHEREWLVSAALFFVMLFTLGACKSFDKSVATGYGLNIVSRDLSTELLNAEKISSADGERIKKVNDEVSSGLWEAWKIRKTYPDSAKATMQTHLDAVESAFKYLKEKEAE